MSRGSRYIKIVFRKLVANLPFSPSLIREVGIYANKLRKEDTTRRIAAIIFTLAIIVQSLAIVSPPESANASNDQDIIRGGIDTLTDFTNRYDHNEDDLKDILSSIGISHDDILSSKESNVSITNDSYILNRNGNISNSSKERIILYEKGAGGNGKRYFSAATDFYGDTSSITGWTGTSKVLGKFSIIKSNGDIILYKMPPTLGVVKSNLQLSISGINASDQNKSLNSSTIKSGNTLKYTVTITNNSSSYQNGRIEVPLNDALEYTNFIDSSNGIFDNQNKIITWPSTQIPPKSKISETFTLQALNNIPATSNGLSNPNSYDCRVLIVVGNVLKSNVKCPSNKILESIIESLPKTSLTTTIIFTATILLVSLYFYVRALQLKKELRIIRHNFNNGSI